MSGKYRLTIFIITSMVALLSFGNVFDESKDDLADKLTMNQALEDMTDAECFDEIMTSWFDEFNRAQETGSTMYKADKKACKIALKAAENCSYNNQ